MKTVIYTLALVAVAATAVMPAHAANDSGGSMRYGTSSRFSSDARQAAGTAAKIIARQGAGAVIGGTAGRIIGGSPTGAAIGILVTPSRTGCAALRGC